MTRNGWGHETTRSRQGARARAVSGLVVLVALIAGGPAGAGGIAIVHPVLSDNGDDDGFPDTHETVEMRLRLRNTSGVPLTGVVARATTDSPGIACIRRDTLHVGSLDVDEERETDHGFVFTVGDVDRAEAGLAGWDALPAVFEISLSADQDVGAQPGEVILELDLDASGGADPTSYFETFESGTLGSFTTDNLDQALHDDPDGSRCQYVNPEWPNANNHGDPGPCAPGPTAVQADATFWHVDADRGFGGTHAMHFGVDLSPTLGATTPLSVLEAVRSDAPVFLAWDRHCELDPATACSGDADCAASDRCVIAAPALAFKHQLALLDFDGGDAVSDRAVVMAQVADPDGNPAGNWIKLDPYLNADDVTADDTTLECTFDPVDDGSVEDDFFEPSDPNRRLGPSSTCYPERVLACLGATGGPFGPEALCRAEGPGLAGETGEGTWVESRFDLSRFRGQRLRVRLLATTIETGVFETWESLFGFNPDPGDDGWYVDDVSVDLALGRAATVVPDTTDNTHLPDLDDADADGLAGSCDVCVDVFDPEQSDADEDGAGDACDCAPDDPAILPADTVRGVTVERLPGGVARVSWLVAAGAEAYAVTRGALAGLAGGQYGGCFASGLVATTIDDPDPVPVGTGLAYLIQGESACGLGPLGSTSGGEPRSNGSAGACGS